MTRRTLRVTLAGAIIEVLGDGRVRVVPAGVLAFPDADAPVEEYPSLKALLAPLRRP